MVRTLRHVQLPDRDVSGYRELADLLREEIASGRLAPGDRFPSESDLWKTYGLSRATVRLTALVLRLEGLIVVRHGHGSVVRQKPDSQPIDLDGIERISTRLPTPDERERVGVDEGVPIWVVQRAGQPKPELLSGELWHVEPSGLND